LTIATVILRCRGVRWGAVRVTGRLEETRAAVRALLAFASSCFNRFYFGKLKLRINLNC
jgi:hypothetical protein